MHNPDIRAVISLVTPLTDSMHSSRNVLNARVVLLTNFIPPYRLPLYEAISDRVEGFTVLVSTLVEGNRSWRADSGHLDVRVQRGLTVPSRWRHPAGFTDKGYVHVPWDTILQLRELRPDVVIAVELGVRSLLSALYCLGHSPARLILWATLSERSEDGRGRLRHAARQWLLERTDRVIVNGASGERYVSRFGVPSSLIDRVPYVALPGFLDTSTAVAIGRPVRHLLYVGQLSERKGLLPFLRCLNAWAGAHPAETVTLTVAGSGPLQAAIEGFERCENLAIDVLGDRDSHLLPALFARADALVFPTLADEWGVVVNEALASGVPVLGSIHSQAVEELCKEGETGWLFDPEDDQSAASAISRALATDPSTLSEMREHARALATTLTPGWAADRVVAGIKAALAQDIRRRR